MTKRSSKSLTEPRVLPGVVTVTRQVHFTSAHRLVNPGQSRQWNLRHFGLCSNPNWHGHNYVLEVSIRGTPDPRTGIMRSFYEHQDEVFSFPVLRRVLAKYQRQIGSFAARIKLSFSYPMLQPSLRSGLAGWQYYRVAYEGTLNRDGEFSRMVEFDFVYSSTCPCSAELAEHARSTRGAYATPSLHSHDAVSVICKGVKGGLKADFSEFESLVC